MTYRVPVERDETGTWIAHVVGVPGCHSYGRSLRQARSRIREALSLWVDDAADADLDFEVRLPTEVRLELRRAAASRERASRATRDAQERTASTVVAMVRDHGLSMRDAAELLGLSHQRVQQLVAERGR